MQAWGTHGAKTVGNQTENKCTFPAMGAVSGRFQSKVDHAAHVDPIGPVWGQCTPVARGQPNADSKNQNPLRVATSGMGSRKKEGRKARVLLARP